MKIKNWIYSSYIFVILVPSILGFILYHTLVSYNSDLDIFSYIKLTSEMQKYEKYVDKPEVYTKGQVNRKLCDKLKKKNVYVVIYNKYGVVLYSSKNDANYNVLNKPNTYKDLYRLNIGYSGCDYKKPVFSNNELVGFYEITIVNNDLIKSINNNTTLAYVIFGLSIIAVFVLVTFMMNKKINRPIKKLIKSMKKFGRDGEDIPLKYFKNDEIGELISQYESMKKEIIEGRENKLKEQKQKEYMIAAMSHDLKSPLTSIRAYAESIRKSKKLSEQDKLNYADVIISKSDYMNRLIEDLLSYTLLTNPEYKMNFINVDGEEFFETLFSGYEETCERNNAKFIWEFDVNGNYVLDIKHMVRLFDNLMMNSIRYAGEDRIIWAGAVSDEVVLPDWIDEDYRDELDKFRKNGVLIAVKNNGKPISENEKERIFKPFYQAGNPNNMNAYNGVGLGLSIVKMIIDKHNGKVKAFSSETNGTLFACWIKRV
jgi:signal transduction histidine kinase